ncbi:MAG: VRR-NUC domain-containing protein [Bacteroidales bacterium]|nr:VRR-NUC domain-containing protein [Bacteroidales bacterium]
MRHIESTLQCNCVKWFKLQYPKLLLFAVPNGGNRDAITGAILKKEGVLAGVADLFLDHASQGFHGLRIEMKTEKGRQSESQKEYQRRCEENGYKYVVCRSFDEFTTIINEYLNERRD